MHLPASHTNTQLLTLWTALLLSSALRITSRWIIRLHLQLWKLVCVCVQYACVSLLFVILLN